MLVLFILPLHVAIILEQELIQNKLMLSVDPGFCEVGMCPCQCQHSEPVVGTHSSYYVLSCVSRTVGLELVVTLLEVS